MLKFHDYSEKDIEAMKKFSIDIPENRIFIPGVDCQGEEPFGKSDACYGHGKCYGVNGVLSLNPSLTTIPCNYSMKTESVSMPENMTTRSIMRGVAGID